MKVVVNVGFISLLVIFCSCSSIRRTSKYQLSDGYYKSKLFDVKKNTVYIDNSEDTITIYPTHNKNIDTSKHSKQIFTQLAYTVDSKSKSFNRTSFDIDFLTIPFKYRLSRQGFPRQFNTNLNGAIYLGYRNDVYHLRYEKTPLKNYQRYIQHYGISFGFFTGLGGTTINPSVTNSQLNSEYDGVVWSKGIAGIFAINSFTIGLAIGSDDLLDNNKKFWLYQRKAWIGLAFGLNLN